MSASPSLTVEERLWRAVLWGSSILVFAFLMVPLLAIIPLSFNGGPFLTYPLQGVSLRWYETVLSDPDWASALRNSLIVGSVSTGIATVLGTLAAVGLARARFPGHGLVMAVVLSPMIVPVVIVAVGFYLFFAPLGLTGSYAGLILAHTALAVPFVVITVSATLQGYDVTLSRAAASLGAGPLLTFRRVTLPLIAPGVASGGLFAFATSFDEVVVVLLVAGPGQRTLPREMFSGIRESINPSIMAVATLLIVFSTLLLITLEVLRRHNEKVRGIAR
ncbi:ABC transporter permease [Pararhodospirillum oryzae]|uniref:Polyamine ABC transporter permease n=1 Tax=Pararhodospirillum oryzae TaxID=478448 RepID=A0A512H724_9PROT|nr:ABC transporter permease [Pararhodospirillum oryzae]GEO81247.1 polyamine ABC transporter permease [Pararhodospirillum oryzae]